MLVLLMHSTDEGRMLRLGARLSVEVDYLHALCAQLRKICLTLTCHSRDLRFTQEITLSDALNVWAATSSWAKSAQQRSAREIIDFMRTTRQAQVARGQIDLQWIVAATAGGALLYTSVVDESGARRRGLFP